MTTVQKVDKKVPTRIKKLPVPTMNKSVPTKIFFDHLLTLSKEFWTIALQTIAIRTIALKFFFEWLQLYFWHIFWTIAFRTILPDDSLNDVESANRTNSSGCVKTTERRRPLGRRVARCSLRSQTFAHPLLFYCWSLHVVRTKF